MELEDALKVIEEKDAALASMAEERNKILSKNEELLTETKQNKAQRRAAEEAAENAAKAKLQASGDFEQLHKSSELEREKLSSQLAELQNKIASEKTNNAAMKLAGTLAEGSNVELLSAFIAPRLKHADDEIKVLNIAGELTVSTLDDLKKEFESDPRYSALLKGNQSSGGSATGGANGNGVAKEKTRAEFDALSHADRSKFFSAGGKVTD